MQKTTLYLQEGEYMKLKRIAQSRRQTPAELVRAAVAEFVERNTPAVRARSVGAFHSGQGNLSERVDNLLEGLGSEGTRFAPES